MNEEAIHEISGDETLKSGDLLKLDLGAEKNGFVDLVAKVGVMDVELGKLMDKVKYIVLSLSGCDRHSPRND